MQIFFEPENQGASLYSVPINYGTTSVPFIADVKAKGTQWAQRTRDLPYDGEVAMQPIKSQR